MGTKETMEENRKAAEAGGAVVRQRLDNLSKANKQLNFQVNIQAEVLRTFCYVHGVSYEHIERRIKERMKAGFAENEVAIDIDGGEVDGGWV